MEESVGSHFCAMTPISYTGKYYITATWLATQQYQLYLNNISSVVQIEQKGFSNVVAFQNIRPKVRRVPENGLISLPIQLGRGKLSLERAEHRGTPGRVDRCLLTS